MGEVRKSFVDRETETERDRETERESSTNKLTMVSLTGSSKVVVVPKRI
jgi:hypothetical protein